MKKVLKISIVTILCLAFVVPAYSDIKKVGQSGLQFLKVGMSARAAGMAGAYTMVGNDADAIFYNPAGIADMDNNLDFTSTLTQWIGDLQYGAVGVVKNLGIYGNVGLSAVYSDYGDEIYGTRVANNELGYVETGEQWVSAYAVGVSYARSLTSRFSIGGTVKYAYQRLGRSVLEEGEPSKKNEVSGLVYDFGTVFYTGWHSHRIGMSVRNFSTQWKYEEYAFDLPLTFNIGMAMNILDLVAPEHQNPLVLSIDAAHPRDYTERINVGGEYVYNDVLAIRAGYLFNYDEQSVSAGIGLNQNIMGMNIQFDYAYSSFGIFNTVNRFSFGLTF